MAKGTLLTDSDKETIKTVYTGMPEDSKAECVRQEASRILKRELGLSTVQRVLVEVRKHRKEIKDTVLELDKPFSIGSLQQYPYLATVLPNLSVLKKFLFHSYTMPIRWALWFYRLWPLIIADKSLKKTTGDKTPLDLEKNLADILFLTLLYCDYERQWENAGLPLPADTSQFDDGNIETIKQNLLSYYKGRVPPETYELLKNRMPGGLYE